MPNSEYCSFTVCSVNAAHDVVSTRFLMFCHLQSLLHSVSGVPDTQPVLGAGYWPTLEQLHSLCALLAPALALAAPPACALSVEAHSSALKTHSLSCIPCSRLSFQCLWHMWHQQCPLCLASAASLQGAGAWCLMVTCLQCPTSPLGSTFQRCSAVGYFPICSRLQMKTNEMSLGASSMPGV